ncbi:unnamed protein product [Meloidogyne enterolobii]|uniref:Uncharacterized protein n=1 Tax=Meloidogyne enterolobii TaxID=390850 RepID=A0ACB1ACW1_MELEN
MDSVDLETLYEIFPELEEKTEVEAHKIVYDILCGMSKARILADLNGFFLLNLFYFSKSFLWDKVSPKKKFFPHDTIFNLQRKMKVENCVGVVEKKLI